MKISVNDVELYTLTDTQLSVIKDYIPEDILNEDLKRRLLWVLNELYNQSYNQLKSTWDPILAARVASVPTDPDSYAQLVFSQPDYKDRAARDAAIGE
jgi:hypothetical protein